MTASPRDAPQGEITFFFTDVEGSTGLWERDPVGMEAALAEHDVRLRAAIAANDGYIFTTAGDSFATAFSSASAGLAAALDAQLRLVEPCAGLDLRVRMGLHIGTATGRDGDYFGSVVNRCARLMSAGHGGQILLSGPLTGRVRDHLPEGVDLVDLGEHRLKDLLRPEHIFQVRHPELEQRFAPLRTLTGPASNLPTQLTSFVGRDREVAETEALLREHRLVTLTGPGGAGKTRLALQVAAESIEDFPDGVRLVELASVDDPELAYDVVASTIGVHATPDVPLVDTITTGIGTKKILLVLDNCEHVLEPTHRLCAHVLRSCPNIKIVATSRERLGATGEALYPVPTMTIPPTSDLESARASGSVELFVDRAILARPDFEVTADNVESVVAICRRLDGIPLAIELAAARVRVLSPSQIAERLDERFRLLGSSDRGATERHRTLAATIAWSYDHLSEPEQAVFRRASVFSGNFSMDAAEAVCEGGIVDRWDMLELVSGLVDRSMLVPEDADDGEVRYRLLENMRHYGLSLRSDDDQPDAGVDDRHIAYYIDLGFRLQDTERSGNLAQAIAGFRADTENIRTALRRTLDTDQTVDAARMVGAIGYLWYATGAFREGVEWCRELFDRTLDLPDEVLASALHSYSLVLGSWAQPEAGAEMLRRQVEIRRRIGDPARLAAALNNLGALLTDLGHTDEAGRVLSEAIDEFQRTGQSAALALCNLAYVARDLGDYTTSAERCADALAEARAADDAYGIALAEGGVGEAQIHLGHIDEARELITRSRHDFEQLGVAPGVAYNDLLLAVAAVKQDDRPTAATHLIDALVDADGHWYLSAKYWIMLLAAGLATDAGDGATLLGAMMQHEDDADQPQPAWVTEHRSAVSSMLARTLDDDVFEERCDRGRLLSAPDAVTMARRVLRHVVDASNTAPETASDRSPHDGEKTP